MLLYLLLARFIIGASNDNLVNDIQDQMEECSNILKFTKSFDEGLQNMFGNQRRLTADDEVDESLGVCTSVVRVVNDLYNDLEESKRDNRTDASWEDPIILNVGGTQFSTTLATLRSGTSPFFEKMFRNESTATCSADGTFFIDRNPATFQYILDYIRTGDMVVESTDIDLRPQLLEDVEFYELSDEVKEYVLFSSLVGIDLKLSEVSWLNNQLPLKLGGLLFDTSLDGDRSSTFHANCDSEGPTVTIVETTLGVVFGGYTDYSWSSSGGWGADSDAFVFRLRPTPLTRFWVSDSSNAMYRHSSYGPYFGNVGFAIADKCQEKADSLVGVDGYHDLDNYALNYGEPNYRVKQYAVVQAV